MPSPEMEAGERAGGRPGNESHERREGLTAGPPAAPTSAPRTAPDGWLELAVAADVEAVEVVSEILGRVAPAGTSVEPAFTFANEGLAAVIDPTRPAIVRAFIPARDPATVQAAIDEVTAALGHLQSFGLRPIGELETRLLHEADWAAAWKSHFPVIRVGRRIVIRPTWRRHRRRAGDVVLALDPGMAFGTGLHPTTRLCLAELERLAEAGHVTGARVLDVGCGSGILSIAATKLDAAGVVAVDTDPLAVEATVANAKRNGVTRRIDVRRGSIPTGEPPFDLVLANLIASLVIELAASLRDELRPGGRLVASGIFENREPEVRLAVEAAGLRVAGARHEDDWVVLEALRPIRVLFLCTGNSARSQMAEALLARHGGAFDGHSAGVEPKGVNPLTVRALAEIGIDWTAARSKPLSEYWGQPFDYAITVCDRARQACPVFPGAGRMLHWDLEDPADVEGDEATRLAAFRETRNELAERIDQLVREIG